MLIPVLAARTYVVETTYMHRRTIWTSVSDKQMEEKCSQVRRNDGILYEGVHRPLRLIKFNKLIYEGNLYGTRLDISGVMER